MSDEQQDDLTQRISDGSYFSDARDWYSMLYIGPISIRIFYIIVTLVAVSIFIMSIASIINLLPISPRIPFMYSNDDIMNKHPRMERFKEPNEEANPALVKYFLQTYVEMHESYDARRFQTYRAFVKHYSVPNVFARYERATSANNPRSPVRRFGRFADVKVNVQNVTYNRSVQPSQATIQFSTTVVSNAKTTKSDWTATISFEYTDLTERNTYDDALGDYVLDFDEPTFRVLGYEKRERLAASR